MHAFWTQNGLLTLTRNIIELSKIFKYFIIDSDQLEAIGRIDRFGIQRFYSLFFYIRVQN